MPILADNPLENARLLREQAEETDDPRIVRFLLELADEYEDFARAAKREEHPDC